MGALNLAGLRSLESIPVGRLGGLRRAAIALIAMGGAVFGGSTASAQDAIVQPGYAVVTGFAGFTPGTPPDGADPLDYLSINPEGPSARVVDLTTVGPQGTLSSVAKPFTLSAAQIGQVFGVALDKAAAPNIYLAATSAYGLSIFTPDESGAAKRLREGAPGAQFLPGQFGPAELGGGPGSVWRVDGATGEVTLLTTIEGGTGSVASLGGLAFDPSTSQLFVAERGTGIIYRLGLDGTVRGTYDHGAEGRPDGGLPPIGLVPSAPVDIGSPAFDTGDPSTWGITPPARRVFGLAVKDRRLYYSVAQGPQIWSAAITASGSISTARLEVEVPSLGDGVEISSITFDSAGRMYLAERGATTGDYALTQLADEGQSRVLRYVPKPAGDPSPGRWRLSPDVYSVGLPPSYANADGGVALNYGYRQDGTINSAACGATLWSTGERLLDPGDGSEGFPTVDGLQGNLTTLFQPQNTPPTHSWFVDYDDQPGDANFRGYMGALATIPCAGQPTPPPPVTCPPGSYFQGGQCLLFPTCPPGTTFQRGQCVYPQCPPNYVLQQGQCVPPPQVCPQGSVYFQGQCVPLDCPPGLTRLPSGYCACPPNTNYFKGKCVPPQSCPPGYVKLGGICFCPPGQLQNNGSCGPIFCPPDKEMFHGQCLDPCPKLTIRQPDGSCKPILIFCAPPKELFKGSCVNPCPPLTNRQPDGSCKPILIFCPAPKEMFKGSCVNPCPPLTNRQPDGSCKPILIFCPAPKEMFKGSCVDPCPPLTKRQPNGSCKPIFIGPIQPLCDLSTHEFYNGACVPKCVPPKVRKPDGSCGLIFIGPIKPIGPLCNLSTHEFYNGACVPKCVSPQVRKPDGSCGLIFIGPIKPIGPFKQILPICAANEEIYNGACVAKCVSPQVRLNNGACGLQFQLPLKNLQLQPIGP